MKKPDKIEQIQSLEAAINEAIDDRRFFSYIQLHEFEALLFSSNKGFEYYFRKNSQQRLLLSFHPTTTPKTSIPLLKGLPPKDCWL